VSYTLHPGAEQDIADALDFYASQAGPLVARRFLDEFERVAALLVEFPGIGTPGARGAAHVSASGFSVFGGLSLCAGGTPYRGRPPPAQEAGLRWFPPVNADRRGW
jgi:hypothetical protein